MQLSEGGNIFKDAQGQPLTQRINQADVMPTLAWLDDLLPGLDLQNNTLGSTGRKPTSGDLDVAVDANLVTKDQLVYRLSQWLAGQKLDPREYLRKSGISVHLRTPIRGDARNGFVQTDFMFMKNVPFSKFVLTAPADSAYKGQDRNILINSIAKSMGYKLNQTAGIADRTTDEIITDDPDKISRMLLNPRATRDDLHSVETILKALQGDPKRDAKLADAREHFARAGIPFDEPVKESEEPYNEVSFLARLRDRIVNQGLVPLVENEAVLIEQEEPGVGGRAKGIEHLEDLVFRRGTAGIRQALEIAQHAAEAPGATTTVKWDGKPAVIFGRKPDTGEFVLTDGAGFEARTYDGLATSPEMMAQIQGQRAGDRAGLIQIYATLWPKLEAALPANFRGYVKGDLLYMSTPPEVAGNYVFRPNTVEYRIPAKTSLGKRIGASDIGIAMHSMYADQGDERQPLSRVRFNDVPGLLLIEPIYGKEMMLNPDLVKQLQGIVSGKGAAIDTLFNPAELRAAQITDLAKLCVDYINRRIDTGNFDNLLPGFGEYLRGKVTPRKFNNIIEYLKSPRSNTDGLAAAFTAFILLHDLKLDILRQLDIRDPGHEGWVMATPAGYAKAVNRFDFTARNRAQNNPPKP